MNNATNYLDCDTVQIISVVFGAGLFIKTYC